ncbi:MAG TPA: serine hydrolase [Bacteroidia bacterium]|nr:serine hydrolase [Bacteroidia bacterium]
MKTGKKLNMIVQLFFSFLKKSRLGVAVLVFIGAMAFSGCKVGRFVWYNFSDITDHRIFPSRPLHQSAQPFRFVEAMQNEAVEQRIIIENYAHEKLGLKYFLEKSPTVAFLVIRNDSLLYERYFRDYEAGSTVASFSMAKSYVSALVGIAIAEGKIKSEDDLVINYITELKGKKGWDKVTVHHLLQMSSGVKFGEGYNTPFSGAASFYYGRTLRSSLAHLKIEKEPMAGFDYKSVNTELLGLVLERATGKHLTEYLDEKIWQPLGAEYDGSWSIDKKNNGLEKAFCCINAKARDFAKFGRLYLNTGNWNGVQVVPAEWVQKSLAVNTEPGTAWYYNRQWWLGSKEDGDFSAVGHLGQYIYVYPKKNLVIVRLGESRAKEDWIHILRQVAKQF